MTTKLFVIANVKQLRTCGSSRILLPFFRTSWGVGILNSGIFNSFHNWVEFGTILEGLRNFGTPLFMCDFFFNYAISSADCITSNDEMIVVC